MRLNGWQRIGVVASVLWAGVRLFFGTSKGKSDCKRSAEPPLRGMHGAKRCES